MVKIGVIFMSFSNATCHFRDTVDPYGKVSCISEMASRIWKWHENNTITFSSKMLIRQCFTSLENTFLVDGLNSLYYGMYLNFEAAEATLNEWNVSFFLLFYNALDLNNQKIMWLPSIFQFERTVHNLNHFRLHLRQFVITSRK